MKRGLEQGLEQGEEKSRNEREIEIAKNALDKGLDLSTVSAITGLSEEEIQKVR